MTHTALCPTCQGVVTPSPPDSYSVARGRLIVSNGFCQGRCAEPEPVVLDEVKSLA